jgi:hypothetical protein
MPLVTRKIKSEHDFLATIADISGFMPHSIGRVAA